MEMNFCAGFVLRWPEKVEYDIIPRKTGYSFPLHP